jgi:hypothetical protein
MAVQVCSLIVSESQRIPGDGAYHIVHFPYGDAESYDVHGMHQTRQPDGGVSAYPDDRSGLIWPSADGWGSLTAVIQWEPGDYSELRDQYVRDPLGLAGGADTTGTDHRAPSPGMQCFTKHHEIFVHPGTSLALRVAHLGSGTLRLVHAQFKLAIHT